MRKITKKDIGFVMFWTPIFAAIVAFVHLIVALSLQDSEFAALVLSIMGVLVWFIIVLVGLHWWTRG